MANTTILEFDKAKQLKTSWPISYNGETVTLQLVFDVPTCACYKNITSAKIQFFGFEDNLHENVLVESSDFTMHSDSVWTGSVTLSSEALDEYLDSVDGVYAPLLGLFVFEISSNKIVQSQEFSVKIYKEVVPPTPVIPEDIKEYIDSKYDELLGMIDTLSTTMEEHISDTVIHVTAEDKERWNA